MPFPETPRERYDRLYAEYCALIDAETEAHAAVLAKWPAVRDALADLGPSGDGS